MAEMEVRAVADWKKMKKEYISTDVSYRKLSEKYGVSLKALAARAKAENWVGLRKQTDNKCTTKILDLIADRNAQIDQSVFDAAMVLMEEYMRSIKAAKSRPMPLTPGTLKDYASALKGIQSVLDRPSDLDIQEQQARIDKLRKETEQDQAADVSIEIKGWDDSWAK